MNNRTVGIVVVLLVVLGIAIYINAQRHDAEWQDGTYTAQTAQDERGYYGEIQLVISNNKITKVDYEEKDSSGKPKGADYPYQAGPESHPKYEEALLKTQDPEKVDLITGATQTGERFKEAAIAALKKAGEGDESMPEPLVPMPQVPVAPQEPTTMMKWKDGTYTSKTEPDQYGYYGEIELVIADEKITEVNYDEKDEEGKPKGADYPYPEGPESEPKYEEQLLQTQDPNKVEVITGATETWERFKETANDALKKAANEPLSKVD